MALLSVVINLNRFMIIASIHSNHILFKSMHQSELPDSYNTTVTVSAPWTEIQHPELPTGPKSALRADPIERVGLI